MGSHIWRMVYHMKTTLNISEPVMKALKREAAATGRTMSELVESALRAMLSPRPKSEEVPDLPVFDGGRSRVDVANREALYDVMESG